MEGDSKIAFYSLTIQSHMDTSLSGLQVQTHVCWLIPEEGYRIMDGGDILSNLVKDRPVPEHQRITQRAGLELQ